MTECSNADINRAIRIITRYIVKELIKEKNCNENEAFQYLIKTGTYKMLQNKKTELYAESPEYVLDMLRDELSGDWEKWCRD